MSNTAVTKNLPRNHHVIGQLVLRGFSGDRINVVGVRRPATAGLPYQCAAQVRIKRTAMVRDFNAVQTASGETITTLETVIANRVESPAAIALDAIRRATYGPLALSPGQRQALCMLAGLLYANSPAGRERLDEVIQRILPDFRGGAPPAAIDAAAGVAALDPNDAGELAAWREAFAFMRDGATAAAEENLRRMTILWGRMTCRSLSRMAITVYRLENPPFLLLPDLPVLGKAPPGGDVPDSGSCVLFPFDHQHLLVFDADGTADEIRHFDDPRINALLRPFWPAAPPWLTTAWHWNATISWRSMVNEAYALRVQDVAVAARLAEPGVRIRLKSSFFARGPGIDLT